MAPGGKTFRQVPFSCSHDRGREGAGGLPVGFLPPASRFAKLQEPSGLPKCTTGRTCRGRASAMRCREFREQHSDYMEGTLPASAHDAMCAHAVTCDACARHDAAMRRGLMVLRSLPEIYPTPNFYERPACRLGQVDRADAHSAAYRGPGLGSFVVGAAAIIAAGLSIVALSNTVPSPRSLSLPPVVAMRPAIPLPSVSSSGFAASAAVGLPVWPAVMMAEQAPVHFASAAMEFAR